MNSTTLSGKRLTIGLLIVLLATGGLFYWVTTAYSAYNAARRETDRQWRELAALLEDRYEALDKRVEDGIAQQVIPASTGNKWRGARDSFKATTISTVQIDSANEVEKVIAELPMSTEDTHSPELNRSLEEYQQASFQQRRVGSTAGSRLLKLMLNLPEPHEFRLH